nr:helix-turn-helix domain-containing protein [uncultured Desulfobacter sp.]
MKSYNKPKINKLCAMELFDTGENVTDAAFEVGYRDVSAFIVAFKKAFGTTIAKYFKSRILEGNIRKLTGAYKIGKK